jgi:formylglycine-generating enzyme required for sulfatase activity
MSSAACARAPEAPTTVVVVVPPSPGTAAAAATSEEAKALTCPANMVFLAGGTMRSGNRTRAVADVCLDVTEVTAGAYSACVDRGACSDSDLECDDAWTYKRPALLDHPINCVSWAQADRYCRAQGKRLPSWEEWEWAAQGRTDQRRFAWGDAEPATDQICWSLGRSLSTTCPVGSHPRGRSAQGVDDLFGNVWEWLSPAMRNGAPNVARGAAWQNDSMSMLEGENAGSFVPGFVRNDVVGFRCAYDGGRPRPPSIDPGSEPDEPPPDP